MRLPYSFIASFSLLVLIALISGCHNNSDVAAAGAAPPMLTTVGPIPGAQATPIIRTDPYIGDPVALQNGRRAYRAFP